MKGGVWICLVLLEEDDVKTLLEDACSCSCCYCWNFGKGFVN